MDYRLIISFVVGFIVCYLFFRPETIEKIVETVRVETDTVYTEVNDTIRIPFERIKTIYIRDTIIQGTNYPINRFSGLESVLYGDIGYSGLVAGQLLNINLTTNFKFPEITNTITKETTRTVIQRPTGLYAVGGINSTFHYSVGAVYLRDRSIIGFEYQPQLKIYSGKVGFRVF